MYFGQLELSLILLYRYYYTDDESKMTKTFKISKILKDIKLRNNSNLPSNRR